MTLIAPEEKTVITIDQIRGLATHFFLDEGTVRAVDGIDLDIDAGSFTVVMGPSGSGKSTLLHLIGGLDRPTAGSISVEEERLEKMDENQLAEYNDQRIRVRQMKQDIARAKNQAAWTERQASSVRIGGPQVPMPLDVKRLKSPTRCSP